MIEFSLLNLYSGSWHPHRVHLARHLPLRGAVQLQLPHLPGGRAPGEARAPPRPGRARPGLQIPGVRGQEEDLGPGGHQARLLRQSGAGSAELGGQ